MSVTWSRSALPTCLYGYGHESAREPDGSVTIIPTRVTTHRWGTKEVPSGLFELPGAENVSAVLFNSSGTISKFNRMGVIAGFGSEEVVLIRHGMVIDPDPRASEPDIFLHVVHKEYVETWMEGMDVYHNPRATHPLDPAMIPGAAHHRLLDDGQIESVAPGWQPLTSRTSIMLMHARPEAERSSDEVSPQ